MDSSPPSSRAMGGPPYTHCVGWRACLGWREGGRGEDSPVLLSYVTGGKDVEFTQVWQIRTFTK